MSEQIKKKLKIWIEKKDYNAIKQCLTGMRNYLSGHKNDMNHYENSLKLQRERLKVMEEQHKETMAQLQKEILMDEANIQILEQTVNKMKPEFEPVPEAKPKTPAEQIADLEKKIKEKELAIQEREEQLLKMEQSKKTDDDKTKSLKELAINVNINNLTKKSSKAAK